MKQEFPSITCPKCKMVSYHTDDIKYKYCGNCHNWHEYMNGEAQKTIRKTLDDLNEIFKNQPKYCEYPACLIQRISEHWHINEHILTFRKPE